MVGKFTQSGVAAEAGAMIRYCEVTVSLPAARSYRIRMVTGPVLLARTCVLPDC